jgi:hypothetical protein
VQHKPLGPRKESGLVFIFDTYTVPDDVRLTLQAEEISAVHWLSPTDAVDRHTPAGRARLAAAFRARDDCRTAYLDADHSLL